MTDPAPEPDEFIRPELTGRLIDMRMRTWGHNLTMMTLDDEKMSGTVLGWCSPLPEVGDRMIWDVSEVVITKVKPFGDPPDMFKVWFLFHAVAHSES